MCDVICATDFDIALRFELLRIFQNLNIGGILANSFKFFPEFQTFKILPNFGYDWALFCWLFSAAIIHADALYKDSLPMNLALYLSFPDEKLLSNQKIFENDIPVGENAATVTAVTTPP